MRESRKGTAEEKKKKAHPVKSLASSRGGKARQTKSRLQLVRGGKGWKRSLLGERITGRRHDKSRGGKTKIVISEGGKSGQIEKDQKVTLMGKREGTGWGRAI